MPRLSRPARSRPWTGRSWQGRSCPVGALARIFPLYEMRESQVGMLRAVCDSFNGDEICAAEAGTGVGKSIAYLVPAVAWAEQNGERVVVSTNTINLQQQLVEKDIPLVKRVLGVDTKVVLVKGRGNYLCQVRLAEALEEMSLFEEQDPDLLAIQEWARTTETGSRTDLSFYPADELWSRVCSEADACQGLRCRYREGCFVLRARREAASARVLVANHHLLFADLAFRMAGSGFDDPAVLPPFKRIIFDEAHNIEKAATSFFSQSFSRFLVQRFLGRLHRRRRGRVTGHFPALAKLLGRSGLSRKIPLLIAEVQEKVEALDAACLPLLGEEAALLLDSEALPRLSEAAGGMLASLSASIRALDGSFVEAFEKAGEKPLSAEAENVVWECKVQLSRLNGIADICDRFRAGEPGPNDIFWMEAAKGAKAERAVRLVITPLAIGPLMQQAVFEPFKTVVLTSATLTVAGRFTYWAGRIGLGARGAREPVLLTFPSPFNYRENVLLGVPTDAPAPDSPGYRDFLAQFISRALLASHGAGLVLFTSYALLRETAEAVRPALAGAGIRLMRQGEGDRARLLDAFRRGDLERAVRHGFVLGGGGCSRGDAPGRGPVQAALPRALGAGPARADGSHREGGGKPVCRAVAARCRGSHAAGIRQAHAPARRPGSGAGAGFADRDKAVRRAVPGVAARHAQGDRARGRGAARRDRLLRLKKRSATVVPPRSPSVTREGGV